MFYEALKVVFETLLVNHKDELCTTIDNEINLAKNTFIPAINVHQSSEISHQLIP
jgi:hypothetical protein